MQWATLTREHEGIAVVTVALSNGISIAVLVRCVFGPTGLARVGAHGWGSGAGPAGIHGTLRAAAVGRCGVAVIACFAALDDAIAAYGRYARRACRARQRVRACGATLRSRPSGATAGRGPCPTGGSIASNACTAVAGRAGTREVAATVGTAGLGAESAVFARARDLLARNASHRAGTSAAPESTTEAAAADAPSAA